MPSSMPEVDITSNEQNAFVQDWLIAWARGHTVFGSTDWEKEAYKWVHEKKVEWAKTWRVTVKKLIEDAELFQRVIDQIQETYGAG